MTDGMHIEIRGLLQVMAYLAPAKAHAAIRRGLAKAALVVKGEASKYPPGSGAHRPQAQNWTDRQRRGFFAALRAGDIEVPYRRGISPGSQRHGQSWTTAAKHGGLTQVIGSDTTYGPLLQDPAKQTAYHATTGWQTTKQVAEKTRQPVTALVNNEIWLTYR